MYGNSSGANGSYSLTFLGKKVGRHRSVAPAGKQRECIACQQLPSPTYTLAVDCINLFGAIDNFGLISLTVLRLYVVGQPALYDNRL